MTTEDCPACATLDATAPGCRVCYGKGRVNTPSGYRWVFATCLHCRDYYDRSGCPRCLGAGRAWQTRKVPDSQRRKAYKAERVDGALRTSPFATFRELERFVEHVCASAWVVSKWGRSRIRVTYNPRKGKGSAEAWGSGHIAFGPESWTKRIALHEIAHCLTPEDVGHGREWARVYVELVQHFEGRAAADSLKAAFKSQGVKYTKPRQYTAEQREALRERGRALAAARHSQQAQEG